MQKIIPNLWFDRNAEEAANFYTSVFDGHVKGMTHYPEAGKEIHGMNAGEVLTVHFEVWGYEMVALNGGPVFNFTPAISFMVNCGSAEEVDKLWSELSPAGETLMELGAYPFSERYGWLKDKYGLSWQLMYRKDSVHRKIFPSLLFVGDVAGRAEEAMNLYTSTFPKSGIGMISRYGAGQEPDVEGTVMYGEFTLAEQTFSAMDSAHPAHAFTFNEAVSLIVNCSDQREIDEYWGKLSHVPEAEQCGWLKDKFGVSWQIVPRGMEEMLNNPDKEKANRAMEAMLSMKKIDIEKLKAAAS